MFTNKYSSEIILNILTNLKKAFLKSILKIIIKKLKNISIVNVNYLIKLLQINLEVK